MLQARTVQRLLTSASNGAAEGIHVEDLDGRYVMMNQAAAPPSASAPRAQAGIGLHPRDLLDPDAAETLLAADAAVLAADAPRSFEITRRVRGEPRWFALTNPLA
jgi:PAS domain-containing protein